MVDGSTLTNISALRTVVDEVTVDSPRTASSRPPIGSYGMNWQISHPPSVRASGTV